MQLRDIILNYCAQKIFNIGDKIEYMDRDTNLARPNYTAGKIYEVLDKDDQRILVENDCGQAIKLFPTRFRKA